MAIKKDFKKGMEALIAVEQVSRGLWASDGQESMAARQAFDQILAKNYGDAAPVMDYDGNRGVVMEEVSMINSLESGRVVGTLGNHLEDLVAGVSKKDMADHALNTVPMTTGNAAHDKSVKAHKKIGKYSGLLNEAQENYRAVTDKVVEMVEEELDKKLTSKKANKLNENLDPEIVDAVKEHLTKLAKISQGYGVQVLKRGYTKAVEKFEGTFPEGSKENAMAKYAKTNLKAQVAKGDREALQAANVVYSMIGNK